MGNGEWGISMELQTFKKMKSATLVTCSLLLGTSLVCGCFNEPTPASKTVPAENRVYLSDKGLKDLSTCADAFKAGAAIDYVNLDRNALETLPPEISSLTGLKWLRLNDNRLTALPDLKALVNLRRIYLKNNRFATVPEVLKDLPTLTDVDLSGNPIRDVPDWFAARQGLKNVSLTRTMVTKLPEDLSAWSSLQSLQLGDLKISADEMARIRKALPKVAIVF